MHRNPPDPRRSGFTLAEALVAVGIIAVLISILLPSLGRVREQGRIVVCASNERRIYEAVVSYANDNDRYLPCPLFLFPGNANKNSANVSPGTAAAKSNNGGDQVCWAFKDAGGPVVGMADFSVGSIVTYMGGDANSRQRIAWCPSEVADPALRNFSYSFNSGIRPASNSALNGLDPYLTLRLSDIRNGEQKILLYEERSTNIGGANARPDDAEFTLTPVPAPKPENAWGAPAWISGRHGASGEGNPVKDVYQDTVWRSKAKSNQLFFDGHIELMDVEGFYDPDPRPEIVTRNRAGPTYRPLR